MTTRRSETPAPSAAFQFAFCSSNNFRQHFSIRCYTTAFCIPLKRILSQRLLCISYICTYTFVYILYNTSYRAYVYSVLPAGWVGQGRTDHFAYHAMPAGGKGLFPVALPTADRCCLPLSCFRHSHFRRCAASPLLLYCMSLPVALLLRGRATCPGTTICRAGILHRFPYCCLTHAMRYSQHIRHSTGRCRLLFSFWFVLRVNTTTCLP